MSRRVLGASVFLNSFRRRHQLREALSRMRDRGGSMRLGDVLDALDVHDDMGFRRVLAQLEGSEFEVVVQRVGPVGRRYESAPASEPSPQSDVRSASGKAPAS